MVLYYCTKRIEFPRARSRVLSRSRDWARPRCSKQFLNTFGMAEKHGSTWPCLACRHAGVVKIEQACSKCQDEMNRPATVSDVAADAAPGASAGYDGARAYDLMLRQSIAGQLQQVQQAKIPTPSVTYLFCSALDAWEGARHDQDTGARQRVMVDKEDNRVDVLVMDEFDQDLDFLKSLPLDRNQNPLPVEELDFPSMPPPSPVEQLRASSISSAQQA